MNPTLQEALSAARRRLPGEAARLEAELLLAHVLACPRSHVLAWPDRRLDAEQARRYAHLVARRAAGVPIAYLLGRRAFWTFDLEVTPDTLIPRPETELLVEAALARLPAEQPVRVLDAGTGSGAVALALARERPRARVLAVERSAAALRVAERNRRRLQLHNVLLLRGDWLAAIAPASLDLVVANPPYVAAGDPHLRQGDLVHEPSCALVAGADGLEALRSLIPQAAACLRPNGWLLVEHGHDQAPAVATLAKTAGFQAVRLHRDLAGLPRVTEAQGAAV